MSWGDPALPTPLREGLSAQRIPCFDGVRGAAMLLILATHLKLVPGHVALNVFFALSGFLITWLLLEEERSRGRVSLRSFYIRRSLRIFPAYYMALLVIVVLMPPSWGPLNSEHVQSTALYYSNYYQAVHGATHGSLSHFWSLSMEEQFYLLWPGLCLLVPRRRAEILCALIAAVWWQRYVVCWEEGSWEWAYHALDCRADHVFVGCLGAVLIHEGRLTRWWQGVCRTPSRMGINVFLVAVLTVLPGVMGKPYRAGVAFYFEPWLITVLLLQMIAFRSHRSVRWLTWGPLVRVGEVSYAVYLYHLFAMDLVGQVLPDASRFVHFIPVVVLSVVLAQLSWLGIERPAQWLTRRLTRREKAAVPDGPSSP